MIERELLSTFDETLALLFVCPYFYYSGIIFEELFEGRLLEIKAKSTPVAFLVIQLQLWNSAALLRLT